MWGRKQEPSQTEPDSQAAPEAPTPPRTTEAPPSAPRSSSTAAGADHKGRSPAQIGKSLKLRGEITGSEDLLIDGHVEGTVDLSENSLTVGPNGKVRAHVKARSITVLGRLEGNVHAGERVEIQKTGLLEGDVVTPRIVIEDGAVFRGSIDILQPSGERRSVVPERKPVVSPSPGPKAVAAAAAESGAIARPKPADPAKA